MQLVKHTNMFSSAHLKQAFDLSKTDSMFTQIPKRLPSKVAAARAIRSISTESTTILGDMRKYSGNAKATAKAEICWTSSGAFWRKLTSLRSTTTGTTTTY